MGKGANQNMGLGGVQQAQMNLVPPYQPPSMGGKGGMQQQPPNMSNFQQPNFDAVNALSNMFGGAQQPTQQPVTSPQPVTFGQPGSPGYRPTIDNTAQPVRRPAVPDFLRPYVNQLAERGEPDRMPRPAPGGFFRPTPRPDPFQNFMQRRNDFINSDNDLNTIRYQQMVLEDKMRRQQAAQQPAAPADMTAADMNANMTAEGADPATAGPAMAQPQPPAFDEGMMNQMDMLNQQYMNRLNQSPFGRPMGRFGPFGRFPGMGGKGVRRPLFGRFGPSMNEGYRGPVVQPRVVEAATLMNAFGGGNPFAR